MTENQASNQAQIQDKSLVGGVKTEDADKNFRLLERKHRLEMDQERQARQDLERKLQEIESRQSIADDDDDEPYVGHKKLDKKFNSFEKKLEQTIEKKAEERARALLDTRDQEDWATKNNDFSEVMKEDNLMKLLNRAPALADSIKRMPDGFEKQKLVYNTIKSMGIDKPETKQPSIQDKIDANKRSPYYQPSGVGAAPYSASSDFSAQGQKQAYAKMQELKNRLRM